MRMQTLKELVTNFVQFTHDFCVNRKQNEKEEEKNRHETNQ